LGGAFSSLVNSSQAWSAFLVSYRRSLQCQIFVLWWEILHGLSSLLFFFAILFFLDYKQTIFIDSNYCT
jgi:hypothetical protein